MMLEGDLYKGTSPHIVGTAVSNDQTSGGDVNFRYQTVQANGTGLMVQAYFDRTLRTHGFLGETRDTIDLDFVDRFKPGDCEHVLGRRRPSLESVQRHLRRSPGKVWCRPPERIISTLVFCRTRFASGKR